MPCEIWKSYLLQLKRYGQGKFFWKVDQLQGQGHKVINYGIVWIWKETST